MLKGQAKRDYQREYMKRKRGLTKGSNIGLTRGSNKGSNLFSVDLLDPSLYDIPIGVIPKEVSYAIKQEETSSVDEEL